MDKTNHHRIIVHFNGGRFYELQSWSWRSQKWYVCTTSVTTEAVQSLANRIAPSELIPIFPCVNNQ